MAPGGYSATIALGRYLGLIADPLVHHRNNVALARLAHVAETGDASRD